ARGRRLQRPGMGPEVAPGMPEPGVSQPGDRAKHAPALLGHGWALDALAGALAAGRATHAYLITGPAQVGKFTTALAMAQVLLCETGGGCGQCRHCLLAERRAHPDLRILERPSERRIIPIKDVHEFTQGIALRPLEAK